MLDRDQNTSRWYALFTQCHHERRVARQLEQLNVEHFLPSYERVSRWKDRTVKLEQPLFPGYLFVRVASPQFRQVLQTGGAVKLVCSAGKPLAVPSEEIAYLQMAIRHYPTEPIDYVQIGERVRIESGPLQGITGVLVRKMGKTRVAITVDTIMRAFTVEVDPALIVSTEKRALVH